MTIEQQILSAAQKAITESIVKELTGYNKPLSDLTSRVIESNQDALYELINGEFISLLNNHDFKIALSEALNKKLASILISKMGGELEKRVNELRSDPATRARLTLAIANLVND